MKKAAVLAVALVAVIGVMFWFKAGSGRNPEKDATTATKSDQASTKSVTPVEIDESEKVPPEISENMVVIREGTRVEDLGDEDQARIGKQQEEIRRLLNRKQRDEFEANLRAMAGSVGLTKEQQAQLFAKFEALQQAGVEDLAAQGSVLALLTDDGLRAALLEIADDSQLEAFDRFLTDRNRAGAEDATKREIAHIRELVPMDAELESRVVEALVDLEMNGGNAAAEPVDVQALFQEAVANDSGDGEEAPNPLEALGQYARRQQVDAQVEALRGILDDEQLEQYRAAALNRFQTRQEPSISNGR